MELLTCFERNTDNATCTSNNISNNNHSNIDHNNIDNNNNRPSFFSHSLYQYFQVFTSLSLFLMLIGPLNAFPWVINGLVESWVSLKRVEKFVNLKDTDPNNYYSSSKGKFLFVRAFFKVIDQTISKA